MREALARVLAGRGAVFWLLAEPVIHVAYLEFIYTVVRVRAVGGIDIVVWIIVGLLPFFMFRRTGTQVMNAVGANLALFSYRQVKPVDALLVRGILEGFLVMLITAILLAGAALMGYPAIPADPLAVLVAFFGLWLMGIGFGLVTSVVIRLAPDLERILRFAMMPLYIMSGVLLPLSSVPQPYRGWLLLNPVPHGLEAVRLGFAPHYHAVTELSVAYLYGFALVAIFLGLALHYRFAARLLTR